MSKYLIKYSATVDGTGNTFGSAADHEQNVEKLLERLMQSQVGHAVFRKIVSHGVVRIEPYDYTKFPPKYGPCNALALGTRHQEKVASGLHRAATKVAFSLSTWRATSPCVNGPGSHGDEVLLHELVHAMRVLGGDAREVKLTGKLQNYHFEEEFFAILVTNIYLSEIGRAPHPWRASPGQSGLRADHASTITHLADAESTSIGFLSDEDNFRLVKKFCDQHTTVAPLMAASPAPFNPLRVYYRWKKLNIVPKQGQLTRA